MPAILRTAVEITTGKSRTVDNDTQRFNAEETMAILEGRLRLHLIMGTTGLARTIPTAHHLLTIEETVGDTIGTTTDMIDMTTDIIALEAEVPMTIGTAEKLAVAAGWWMSRKTTNMTTMVEEVIPGDVPVILVPPVE